MNTLHTYSSQPPLYNDMVCIVGYSFFFKIKSPIRLFPIKLTQWQFTFRRHQVIDGLRNADFDHSCFVFRINFYNLKRLQINKWWAYYWRGAHQVNIQYALSDLTNIIANRQDYVYIYEYIYIYIFIPGKVTFSLSGSPITWYKSNETHALSCTYCEVYGSEVSTLQ